MTKRSFPGIVHRRLSRRIAIGAGAAGLIATTTSGNVWRRHARGQTPPATPGTPAASGTPDPGDVPVSGEDVPELATLDQAARELVAQWGLPGAQLAVGYEGRLVLDRGYGYADRDAMEVVQPEHRFRIASVSKTITAVGILRLVEAGRLSIDDAVFPLLALDPPAGSFHDPQLDLVTVGDLLIHAGGFSTDASGDPQYLPLSQLAASTFGQTGPAEAETIVRFMLGNGVDFPPGSQSIYSNFGFNVLGRVIEHVSGQPYETFIQEQVLGPAGITDLMQGGTRRSERADGEVLYYAPPEYPPAVPSVFPGEGFGPFAYGSFYLPGMDAHGGWIARASDLVRYATAIDGTGGSAALLPPGTVAQMLTAPHVPFEGLNGAANGDPATGLAWVVQDGPLGREWAHTGALGGSTGALLLRNDTGLTIAFITNTLPADFVGFFTALRPALVDVVASVPAWPTVDLFT